MRHQAVKFSNVNKCINFASEKNMYYYSFI